MWNIFKRKKTKVGTKAKKITSSRKEFRKESVRQSFEYHQKSMWGWEEGDTILVWKWLPDFQESYQLAYEELIGDSLCKYLDYDRAPYRAKLVSIDDNGICKIQLKSPKNGPSELLIPLIKVANNPTYTDREHSKRVEIYKERREAYLQAQNAVHEIHVNSYREISSAEEKQKELSAAIEQVQQSGN